MRKSKPTRRFQPTFAIVVDGETEKWYFEMFKRNERHLRVKISPELPRKKSLNDQFELVNKLSLEYTRVFWCVDLDTILKNSREARKGETTEIENFKNYRERLKKSSNVSIIVNNPCLEFWFLLHFENTSKFYDSGEKVEKALCRHLENYEKTQKYFTKQGNDIYLQLKPFLKDALRNANALGGYDTEACDKALCEMPLFFQCPEINEILNL